MKTLILLAFTLIAFSTAQGQATVNPKSDTLQCQGITSKGLQCKSTWVTDGFCRVHNPNKSTCSGITAKGLPCKAVVSHSGDLCGIHSKLTGEDLKLFPNYKQADKEYGQDNRFSDQWCELAAKRP